MAKEVWVMRHGPQDRGKNPTIWHPSAPLSKKGKELVKRVYESHIKGVNFSIYGSSPFLRSMETAAIVANGKPVETFLGLTTISEATWNKVFQLHSWYAAVINDLNAMFSLQSGLLMVEGEWAFQCIERIANRLKNGKKALLVSHQPLIECALAEATDQWPPRANLRKGEIVIFSFEGGKFAGWQHLPLPS